jgi:hypothetical protein
MDISASKLKVDNVTAQQLWEKVLPSSIFHFWVYVACCMFTLSLFASILGVSYIATGDRAAIINPFFTIACVFPVTMLVGFVSTKKRFDEMIKRKLENSSIIYNESKKETYTISAKEIILVHLGYLSVVSWTIYAMATFQFILLNISIETEKSYTLHFAISIAIIAGTFTSLMRRMVREAKDEVERSFV